MQYFLFFLVFFVCIFAADAKFEMLARGHGCEFISNDELLLKISGQFSESGELDLALYVSPYIYLMEMVGKNPRHAFAPCDLDVELAQLDSETSKVHSENFTVSHNYIRDIWKIVNTLSMELTNKDIFEFESLESTKELVRDMKFIE